MNDNLYNFFKMFYGKGVTESQVRRAVELGSITPERYEEITGDEYIV